MPSTKPRIWSYIDVDNHVRLTALARRPGNTASQVVNHALSAFFANEHEVRRDAALIRRLDRMTRQSEVLKRNQIISAEAFALFMRYFLTVIPPVPETDKAAAQAQGAGRFEKYLESLQAVLADGESVLFNALEDVMVDDSAFFTKEELMRLHQPAPDRSTKTAPETHSNHETADV
ncbi:MAG: CopG family transcriptional regulator [Pseudomonadota bacterium]